MEKEALFYENLENGTVKCTLCPHHCVIREGKKGFCDVRMNNGGILKSQVYAVISGFHVDPVEKKPLYHFLPGKKILSIGSFGCNMKCTFCQNCSISQVFYDVEKEGHLMSVEEITKAMRAEKSSIGIAFTYNEPTVSYEFMFEIAQNAKSEGLKTVMISNGYINALPLAELLALIDAFNIDLKAFNNEFYKKITFSEIHDVKNTIRAIVHSGKHLEITNLLIPDLNDDCSEFDAMCRWIADETGKETPLHISKYFPAYRLTKPSTNEAKLEKMYDIALRHLSYVYLGNTLSETGQNTYCPECRTLLIRRRRYQTEIVNLTESGTCAACGIMTNVRI